MLRSIPTKMSQTLISITVHLLTPMALVLVKFHAGPNLWIDGSVRELVLPTFFTSKVNNFLRSIDITCVT